MICHSVRNSIRQLALLATITSVHWLNLGELADGQEIGFVEKFALAEDRQQVLNQLIPGTEEYYYYWSLYHQANGQLDQVDQILNKWIKEHRETATVKIIQNRQALLRFETKPDQTYQFLSRRLNLDFNHQREIPATERDLKSVLNPNLISDEVLIKRALDRYRDLTGFTNTGLEQLANKPLDKRELKHLLQRLRHPDYPNLTERIIEFLQDQRRTFGEFPIYSKLTLAQLETILESVPRLINDQAMVNQYLAKLRPSDDISWGRDSNEYRQYLQRLLTFTRRLNPVFNSLKASVLYRLLEFDRKQGQYNRDLFFEYLKLPRNANYVNRKFLERKKRSHFVNFAANYRQQIFMPPILDDSQLVVDYLNRFLVNAEDTNAFAPYINSEFLKDTFATVKLVNGIGDKERWAARLSRQQFKDLQERVDLDFAWTNREFYSDDDVVSIDLFTKNVDSLIVKIYEVNELNYYRKYRREIDTNLELDGLIPNSQQSYSYNEDPLVRKSRTFEFKELTDQGVYVIDFIGGGKSSRALIRRGRLSAVGTPTIAGQLYRVFDQQNQVVNDAEMWINSNRYSADEMGIITVPYSNQPGAKVAVISAGGFSSLQTINQRSENYVLNAGIYVDRETLLFNQSAKVMVRPGLRISGQPASVDLLENAALTITSVDLDGHSTSKRIENLELADDRETICDFIVPARVRTITFELSANVENISQQKEESLTVSRRFSLNQIDSTDEIKDVHLRPTDRGYVLEVRGKMGETRAQQAARIELNHRDFKDPISVDLQSDNQGRIGLGMLPNIERLSVKLAGGSKRSWPLDSAGVDIPEKINLSHGEPLVIAAPENLTSVDRKQISLFETRGGQFVADRFDELKLMGRQLTASGLAPGDYRLRFKNDGKVIAISVGKGDVAFGAVLGQHRRIELKNTKPLVIEAVKQQGRSIQIALDNVNSTTRVHVLANRYQPRFSIFDQLKTVRDVLPWDQKISIRKSAYLAGRRLSDEYQYILNRQYETKYPGNMLPRPSVLMTPLESRQTDNKSESLADGSQFGNVGSDDDSLARIQQRAGKRKTGQDDFASFNFLQNPSIVLTNLMPDDNGVVNIDSDDLAGMQHIQVVALDQFSTVRSAVNLKAEEAELIDLRLKDGLNPAAHFSQAKQIEILDQGDSLTINDLSSGRFQYFDELNDVFRLFLSMNPNTRLSDFQFLMDWSEKTDQQQQDLYAKFACHELNFYLYKKDPQFFERVIRPHISYKAEQNLIDQFLLAKSLNSFVDDPWRYGKLNVFERILIAQQLEIHSPDITQNIDDLYELAPVTREQFDEFYNAILASGRLGTAKEVKLTESRNADESPFFSENESSNSNFHQDTSGQIVGDFAVEQPSKFPQRGINGIQVQKSRPQPKSKSLGLVRDRSKDRRERNSNQSPQDAQSTPAQQSRGEIRKLGENLEGLRLSGRRGKFNEKLYRRLPKTKEWIEQQYYQLPLGAQRPDLVQANRFWKDYSRHDGGKFLSKYFVESHRSLTEMMFALAVLDLPEKAEKHKFEYADQSLKLTAGGPMIAMHQQFLPAEFEPRNTSILVSENFFQKNDRYRQQDGVRYDKFVTDSFYAHTLYGAQVAVTNPTSTPQTIDLLVQIPIGSITAADSQATRSLAIQLDAFSTRTFEYYFYFPSAGKYDHYPAHVSREQKVLAIAENAQFEVTDKPVQIDKTSWAYVSQNGSPDDVIEFLQSQNILGLPLEKIAFRMKDADLFRRVIHVLKTRFRYNHTLWSYAIRHKDAATTSEFLRHESKIAENVGPYFESNLLNLDPYQRNWYQHREYSPLINARTHKVGKRRSILNPAFHQQYHRLLDVLANRSTLTSEDHLAVTYYMLLQERVEEAIAHFGKVVKADLNEQIQFDYCDAYLDFYLENPESAVQKAQKWLKYPVASWRNRFENIVAQAAEIAGDKTVKIASKDQNQSQKQTAAAAKTAAFDFEFVDGKIRIQGSSISDLVVNYYQMDIEHMFSNSPFELKNLDRFSVVEPTITKRIDATGDIDSRIEIAKEFTNKNVLVEIRSGDSVKAKPLFANSMAVQTIERFGQLQVVQTDSKQPVSKAYIKVYSRDAFGRIKFHKDGYTDLRGRFDYVSQSNNPLDGISRYSILVLSDQWGAETTQAVAPAE